MKRIVASVSIIFLVLTGTQFSYADTPTRPTLLSFTMSPNSVDIATPNSSVIFDLVVSNPTGIASTQTLVTLTDGANNSVAIPITRTDSPVNSTLQTVEFKGSYAVAGNLPAGVYTASASAITGLTSSGTAGYSTGIMTATTSTNLVGATNALLIRNAGSLNFAYPTFVGPAFKSNLGSKFVDPKYNSVAAPIWKVGETFVPSNYYETEVPGLALKVKTNSPSVCTSNGTSVSFIGLGSCEFIVYTDKTLDYQYKEDDEVVAVTSARTKPTYVVGAVATQSSGSLPLSIPGPSVYGPFGLVIPVSATPSVCNAVGTYISIVSGGICTLNYSTQASANYLASDIFPLTFEITRSNQTLSFTAPPTVELSRRSLVLSATASSSMPITYQTSTPDKCTVIGNSLSLHKTGTCDVVAAQAGSATIAPASAMASIVIVGANPTAVKRLICVKNKKSRVILGASCPKGYTAGK